MSIQHLPGLIDCHVHFREPGLMQKGDMQTESRAALAGGVTTVCDMPNTVPPTVTVEAFRDKVERAKRITDCDIRLFFGATEEAHVRQLEQLWKDPTLRARCCGLKLFLDHSTGDQKAGAAVIQQAMELAAKLGMVVVCHCEDPEMNAAARGANKRTDIAAHSVIRPPASEEAAVRRAIALAQEYGARLHIAHLSTKGGAELIRKAKKEGVRVTCETAPHHLFLTVDDYAALGTLAKMNPPVRSQEDRDALWDAIDDGTIDCIATDHAPHMLEEKRNTDPLKAPSGVPGVETMLPLLLTVSSGGWPHPFSPRPRASLKSVDIVRLCFENPNRIFSLGQSEATAGVVEIDTDVVWTIRGKDLHSKCGWTPYEGMVVRGRVVHLTR